MTKAIVITFAAAFLSALVFTKGWQADVAAAASCAVILPPAWYRSRRSSLPPAVAVVLAAMEERS